MRTLRRPWVLYIFATLVYIFLFAPIFHVVIQSFNANRSMIDWGGFTTDWYVSSWTNSVVLEGTRNTFIIAVLVSILSVIIGTSTAIAVQNVPRWLWAILSSLTYARIIMPELVLAIALLIFLTNVNIPRGILGTVIGLVVWNSAYVTVIVAARLAGRDPSMDEAARDLGATRWRAFWRVTLPDISPAVIAGVLLVFSFSFENVVTSFFLSGDINTLPIVILSLIRFEVNPGVNAIGTGFIGIGALILAGYLAVNWRTMLRTRS